MIRTIPPESFSFDDLRCMTGTAMGPYDLQTCKKDNLLASHWEVLDNGQIVAEGLATPSDSADFAYHKVTKFLGRFKGKAHEKYVVEVTFFRNGEPLDVTKPHLIVGLADYY